MAVSIASPSKTSYKSTPLFSNPTVQVGAGIQRPQVSVATAPKASGVPASVTNPKSIVVQPGAGLSALQRATVLGASTSQPSNFASGLANFAQGNANILQNSSFNPNSGQIESFAQQAAQQATQQASQQAQQQEQARQVAAQAAAAEAQRIASARAGFDAQRNGIYGSVQQAGQQAGNEYNQGILGLLDQLRSGQTSLDRQAVQNELARKQGTQGVLGMVGRGIQSAGVMLNNKNASDSSASGAIARAYSQLGQRQLSDVGNQFAQGENALQQGQSDLALQQASAQRNLSANKSRTVDNIVAQATNSLASLDAAMASTPGITDRIQLEQEKERIRSQAMQALAQYDNTYSQGVSGIQPISQQNRQAQALQLANAGQAPDNSFDFTTQAPAQFADTGPFSSNLPIFTFNRNRRLA